MPWTRQIQREALDRLIEKITRVDGLQISAAQRQRFHMVGVPVLREMELGDSVDTPPPIRQG
jgi:hypothetical protein